MRGSFVYVAIVAICNGFVVHRSIHGNKLVSIRKGGEFSTTESTDDRKRKSINFVSSPIDSILSNFSSSAEIDKWLRTLSLSSGRKIFCDWNIREETQFIRALRDCSAYNGIVDFVKNHARNSSFVYTTGIFCLASSQYHKRAAVDLFDSMERNRIRPSSYTFSAIFQAVRGPKQALWFKNRLFRSYPDIEFTMPVWEAAVFACSRGEEPGWEIAKELVECTNRQDLQPTAKLYLALFEVCNSAGDVPHAMELLDQIREEDVEVQMDDRLWGASLQVCATAGEPGVTRLVLETMQEEGYDINVVHCTCYLKALAICGFDEEAMHFLDHMAGLSRSDYKCELVLPKPDRVAVQTVISACGKTGNFEGAMHVIHQLKERSFGQDIGLSTFDYNAALLACRDPNDAKELLREMRLSRRYRTGAVPPNELSYTRALSVCRHAGDTEMARVLLKRAVHDGITPDCYMFTIAIWTAAKASNVREAYRLLSELESRGHTPVRSTYNGIIAALASKKRSCDAVEVFRTMKRKGISASKSTFKYLGRSLRGIQILDSKLEMLEDVYALVEDHEKRASICGPIMAALINTYGSMNRYNDARQLFESIRGPINVSCLRAMLFACSYVTPPRYEDALVFLHTSDVSRDDGLVDPGALSNTMLACSKADEWEESLNLWRLYGDRNTSHLALNSLIAACGRDDRPDVAVGLLNEMLERNLCPDSRTYRNVMIACRNAADKADDDVSDSDTDFYWWECALSILRRMKEEGHSPDMQTYSAAISTCEASGEWQYALRILQDAIDDDMKSGHSSLNIFCFNAAISACEKGGAWVEALEIYESMKGYGGTIEPNFITVSSIVQALDRSGQKELAQEIYKETSGSEPPSVVNPWRHSLDIDGNRILVMDLHKYSGAMARAAVRSHAESLLARELEPSDDWVIVVGRGMHSASRPVLFSTVYRLLRHEYGIAVNVDSRNYGRFVVPGGDLKLFVEQRSWV